MGKQQTNSASPDTGSGKLIAKVGSPIKYQAPKAKHNPGCSFDYLVLTEEKGYGKQSKKRNSKLRKYSNLAWQFAEEERERKERELTRKLITESVKPNVVKAFVSKENSDVMIIELAPVVIIASDGLAESGCFQVVAGCKNEPATIKGDLVNLTKDKCLSPAPTHTESRLDLSGSPEKITPGEIDHLNGKLSFQALSIDPEELLRNDRPKFFWPYNASAKEYKVIANSCNGKVDATVETFTDLGWDIALEVGMEPSAIKKNILKEAVNDTENSEDKAEGRWKKDIRFEASWDGEKEVRGFEQEIKNVKGIWKDTEALITEILNLIKGITGDAGVVSVSMSSDKDSFAKTVANTGEINVLLPTFKITEKHQWKERDKSKNAGFVFDFALSADPLIGLQAKIEMTGALLPVLTRDIVAAEISKTKNVVEKARLAKLKLYFIVEGMLSPQVSISRNEYGTVDWRLSDKDNEIGKIKFSVKGEVAVNDIIYQVVTDPHVIAPLIGLSLTEARTTLIRKTKKVWKAGVVALTEMKGTETGDEKKLPIRIDNGNFFDKSNYQPQIPLAIAYQGMKLSIKTITGYGTDWQGVEVAKETVVFENKDLLALPPGAPDALEFNFKPLQPFFAADFSLHASKPKDQ